MPTVTNLEFGIWNLECVLNAKSTHSKFHIPNSKFYGFNDTPAPIDRNRMRGLPGNPNDGVPGLSA